MDDAPTTMVDDLYEQDFYAWTCTQTALLEQGRVDALDLANLAEEIATLGRKEVAELRSPYTVLVQHLLKQRYQPRRATRSWRTTILQQRIQVARHIRDNPSLRSKADSVWLEAYADARALASSETGLPLATFPEQPPFTRQEAADRSFVPTEKSN